LPAIDGDAYVAKLRADDRLDGFLDVVDEQERWGPWLARKAPVDREMIIIGLQSISMVYRKEQKIPQARYWAEKHLALARTLPEDFGPRESRTQQGRDLHVAIALSGLARLAQIDGDIARAHTLLLEAERHEVAEEETRVRQGVTEQRVAERIMGIGSVRAQIYEDLAKSAWLMGDQAEARRFHELWMSYRNEVPSSANRIEELRLHARFHLDGGRPDAALRDLQQAVAIAENERSQWAVARTASSLYQELADTYGQLGVPRSALAMLDKAKKLADERGNGDAARLASLERSAAGILRRHPHLGDCVEPLLRALDYDSRPADRGGPHTWTAADGRLRRIARLDEAWPILRELAQVLEERNRLLDTERYLRLAAGIAEYVRDAAFEEVSRVAVQEERKQVFIDLARIHLRLAAEGGSAAATYLAAAWLDIETLRARSLLDEMGESEMTAPPDVPANLVVREAELRDRRQQLKRREQRTIEFWDDQRAIDDELTAVWEAIAAASPSSAPYVAVREARPATSAEVVDVLRERRGRSAGPATVVNMIFTDDENLLMLAVNGADGGNGVGEGIRAASARVDRQRLQRFVAANFGSASRVRELASDLEDLFQFELKEVVAPLADLSLPGETLVLCPTGPLHHVPLGAVRLGQDVLLARNALAISPSASVLRTRQSNTRGEAGDENAVFGDPLGDLPAARQEACEVARMLGGALRVGAQADAESLLAAIRTARTVHVAAHASFDEEQPLDSSVVMADRPVSARDILRERASRLDLVTLSACESGIVHAGGAEDPFGLSRALLLSGTASVLLSLWRVADRPAQHLMTEFYENMRQGRTKAESLRQASLSARDRFERLDRWAAFVLAGAWG
jgi:tetratricopeptide (TPR) repeat protein